MSDGPFRNTGLSTRWKEYGQMLVNDVMTPAERTIQACHSMIGDVDIAIFKPLYEELVVYAKHSQIDLDAVGVIEAVFRQHANVYLADLLQKELLANLREKLAIAPALEQALVSSTNAWISITQNRFDEECIRARDCGDMKSVDYEKSIERNHLSFCSIDSKQFYTALIRGDKRAFRPLGHKKSDVDEGPD